MCGRKMRRKRNRGRPHHDKSHPGHGSKAEGNQLVAVHRRTVVDRINKAADDKRSEVLADIFLDAAKVVEKQRKVVTVNELEEQLKPLKKKLEHQIWLYRYMLKNAASKKRRLKYPINKNGEPLKESTLMTYRSVVENWPEKREALKRDIKAIAKELKVLPDGKTITRGNVSLRLIYGGEYPAKYEKEFESGWKTLR